ncbi:hypothetical protein MASR2M15_06170 [Anaerolineales bacterium]
MSQLPPERPLPPELEPMGSPSRPPIPMDDLHQYEYIPQSPDTSIQLSSKSKEGGGCGKGCLWMVLGVIMIGIFGLIVLGGSILVTGQSLSNLLNGAANLFDTGAGGFDYSQISVPVVDRLKLNANLTTVRFNYSHIVSSERDMPPIISNLYGDRLIMVAVGHVTAGIDLSTLSDADFSFNSETLTLTVLLPAPTIQECYLNDQLSYVVSRDTGILAGASPELDNQTRRYAISSYYTMAIEDGILKEAEDQAAVLVKGLIDFADIEDQIEQVVVQFNAPDPLSPLPDTCPQPGEPQP